MANSKLKYFVTQYDGNLYLEDKNDYPVTINDVEYERSEFGIVLIYSFDDMVTKKVDITNSMSPDLDNTDTDLMESNLYFVKKYSAGPINEHEVVFHNEKFYRSLIAANMNTPSDTHVTWELLTESNAASLIERHNSLGFGLKSVYIYSDIPDNEKFSLEKKEDRYYKVINSSSDTMVEFKLYDYENNYLGEVSNPFQVPEDGVYRIQIGYNTLSGDDIPDEEKTVATAFSSLIVIHTDDIECCYKKMITSLYCKDSTYCVDGDCFAEREKLYKINEIQNIYSALLMNMNVSKLRFYNVISDTESKVNLIQEVGRLIKVIRLMVNECKNCCDE